MKRTHVLIPATLLALLVAAGMVASGCDKNGTSSLDYDRSPKNVVVDSWSGGGLAPPWVDDVSEFSLFGDGTILRTDPSSKQLVLIKGKISSESVKKLLEEIKDAGFFKLKDEYVNKNILDGSSSNITVNLKEGKKKVHVYMMDVKEFDDTRKLLMDYPMDETIGFYEPENGYLVVQKSTGGQKAVVDPSSEVYPLLPDAAALKAAAESRKPIAIDGASFVKIKRFEAPQQYAGFAVQADGVAYDVFPIYKPGS